MTSVGSDDIDGTMRRGECTRVAVSLPAESTESSCCRSSRKEDLWPTLQGRRQGRISLPETFLQAVIFVFLCDRGLAPYAALSR